MQPEVRERLKHVIEAGETILFRTAQMPFEDYAADRLFKYGVERAFTIKRSPGAPGIRRSASIAS